VSDDVAPDEEPDEPTEPSPLRRTLDLFVFAPVGVVLTMVEDLPGLIAKGRQRIETEISNARVVGEFVVTQGQREVTQRVGGLLHRDGTAPAEPGDETPPTAAESAESAESATATTASIPAPVAAPRAEPDPADEALVEAALAGYDTLSASQVVRRLESLGSEQLRAVYRHEASHRNRRTILNRTSQLLDATAAPE
jgi:pyruvate/2-oxoglutarate dehydrogenase complex dihydrolipoamide acyltransferase (E2) component